MSLSLVVMGVSGSGKSTVGRVLSERLGCDFVEGDALHPAENVAKLTAGIALSDADREPWLKRVWAAIEAHERAGRDVVVACSALRRSFRDVLRQGHASVRFLHLSVDERTSAARVEARVGHFMPASLVPSQVKLLEPLEPSEAGRTLEGGQGLERIVDQALRWLAQIRADQG